MGRPKKERHKKGKKRKPPKPRLSDSADRYALYQQAVQSPPADIEFFTRVFADLRGRTPIRLREDFCGTALMSCEWVGSDPTRRAIGVDLDAPTLARSWDLNQSRLSDAERRRLSLVCADVRDLAETRADMTCAMNFSFCVFKQRPELLRYFEVAFHGLADEGVFVCELYGGTEAIIEFEEEREVDGFTFRWQQETYNPISNETLCHIHFDMADGSKIKRAFTYDWRLWTVPEVREILEEAGFASSRVFWEQVDDDGDGTGEYTATDVEENQEGWLVYIVAAK
ncbi:MAG: class I SAM-dependent methyltransferase [Acidobacteriota bacterium]|nr:class I SAM-dependent methyltransferase [Acidobacteriota bacterium]